MKDSIRLQVAAWNEKFPLDRWWRKKHKVAFLSEEHRGFSFFAMYFEYYEDMMVFEFKNKKDIDKDIPVNWWKGRESTKQEIDDWFNMPL